MTRTEMNIEKLKLFIESEPFIPVEIYHPDMCQPYRLAAAALEALEKNIEGIFTVEQANVFAEKL